MKKLFYIFYFICILIFNSCGKEEKIEVLSLDQKANGYSYDDLSIAFSNWFLASGLDENPLQIRLAPHIKINQ